MRADQRSDGTEGQRATEERKPMRTRALLLTCATLLLVLVVGVARWPQLVEDDLMTRERGGHVASSSTPPAAPAGAITPAVIALGERVFQGETGGTPCTTCHGRDARGVKGLGPDLTDGAWLHGDGGLDFLKTIIRTGVMQPRQGGVVMPPYGGTPLEPDQLEAVAAYVYSISHE